MLNRTDLESELSQVEELMLQLVHVAPDDRGQRLEQLCDEHPDLAAELRRRFACLEDVGFLSDAGDLGAPERIGDFRILRTLGRGGMGVVYLAQQDSLDRQVALKVLRADRLAFEVARERFRREALVLSRLEHPGVCPIYEVGEVDGTPYLAMRYLEGESLAELVQAARQCLASGCVQVGSSDGGSAVRESEGAERSRIGALIRVFESIARAAHAAHELGLVHRDLKPGNVMITPEGEPVILDFGLAADASNEVGLTLSGDQVGTPAYMAPEQIEPRGRQIDARTDVYALGVTLFECLTAGLPFQASGRESMFRQILAGNLPDVRTRNRHVPRDLAVVVATAMDREPSRRYQSALDVAEDLRRVLAREPIRARPAGALLRTARWGQRNSVLATFVASLVVGLSVTIALLVRLDGALRTTQALALLGLAAERLESDPRASLWLARRAYELEPSTESRSRMYAALARSHEVRRFVGHEAVAWQVVFSPDGASLLSCSDDRTARLWNIADSTAAPLRLSAGSTVQSVAFDSRGDNLLTAARRAVQRWDAHSGAEIDSRPCPGPDELSAGLAMSPGRELALILGGDRPFLWNTTSGEERVLPHPGPVFAGCFSADGSQVATATGWALNDTRDASYSVRVWRVSGGDELLGEFHAVEPFRGVCFTGDGRFVLAACRDGMAYLWDVEQRQMARKLPHAEELWCVAASPAGVEPALLACGGIAGLSLWRTDGSTVAMPPMPMVRRIAFSPDGSTFCASSFGDSTARVFDLRGRELRVLQHGSRVCWAEYSDRDQLLATAAYDGDIHLWRLADPELAPLGRVPDVRALELAADGARVMTSETETLLDGGGRFPGGLGSRIKYGTGVRARWSPRGDRIVRTTWVDGGEFVDVLTRDLQRLRFRPDPRTSNERCLVDFLDDEHLVVVDGWSPIRISVWSCDGRRVGDAKPLSDSAIEARAVDLVVHRPSRRVALAGWKNLCAEVWTPDGEIVGCYRGHSGQVVAVAFSGDGSLLATASTDGTARVFDVDDDQSPATVLQGHDGGVRGVAFAPNRPLVATAGEDGTARIWTLDGTEWARIDPEGGRIWQVVWSPDGSALWTVSEGPDAVRRWPVDDAEVLVLARARSEPLTDDERQRFHALERKVLRSP